MIKKNKTLKNIILVLSVLILMGLIVFIVGRSFGYFNYAKKGDTVNVVSISGLGVDILNNSEDALNLVNVYPMYDNEGLELDPFEFNLLNSTNRSFDIRLKIENDSEKESECSGCTFIGTNYIRYAYSVDNGQYSEPANLGANSNIVLTDTITSHGTKKISIKIWIDKDAPNSIQQAYFYGKVVVEGELSACTLAVGDTIDFDYNGTDGTDGSIQEFQVTCPGYYKLETWGAQGGDVNSTYIGGYGGYSTGTISLSRGQTVYVAVGGKGKLAHTPTKTVNGGYNGGGTGYAIDILNRPEIESLFYNGSGGGATHMALRSGELYTLESYKGGLVNNSYYSSNDILIVAGGGGGAEYYGPTSNSMNASGSNAGGYIGNKNTASGANIGTGRTIISNGGSQIAGGVLDDTYRDWECGDGTFGKGSSTICDELAKLAGGGGGFFGGAAGYLSATGSGGGSGYIANPSLTNKYMTCFNCTTSDNSETKTISNTCHSSTPTADCAKEGNGYARITYLGNTTSANLYSAAVDEIYFYDDQNRKVVLGTTDSTGKLENVIVPTEIPIYSSVAKNPDNLSNPYSKIFDDVGSNTYLMPSHKAIYWYGYNDGVQDVYGNGWVWNSQHSMIKSTFNTNSVTHPEAGSYQLKGLGIINPDYYAKVSVIFQSTSSSYDSSQGYGMQIVSGTNKSSMATTSTGGISNTTFTSDIIKLDTDLPSNQLNYVCTLWNNKRSGYTYAIWAE